MNEAEGEKKHIKIKYLKDSLVYKRNIFFLSKNVFLTISGLQVYYPPGIRYYYIEGTILPFPRPNDVRVPT